MTSTAAEVSAATAAAELRLLARDRGADYGQLLDAARDYLAALDERAATGNDENLHHTHNRFGAHYLACHGFGLTPNHERRAAAARELLRYAA